MQLRQSHIEKHSRTKRYGIWLIIIWTCLIFISAAWQLYHSRQSVLNSADNEADASLNKDLIYRQWAAMHGGVYVPVTDTTQPNPYLDIDERDVITDSGQVLTLINPAYMTRQVYELTEQKFNTSGHITSLNPIRPQNAPDEWETEALKLFETGVTEFNELTTLNGQRVMRHMHALIAEESCLTCHAKQGYQLGDVRGGISVAVPMQPYWDTERPIQLLIILGHTLFGVAGVSGITIAGKRILHNMQQQAIAGQAISEHIDQYRAITSTTSDGFCITDRHGQILDANQTYSVMTGYSYDELLTMSIFTMESQDAGNNNLYEHIKQIVKNGSGHFETRHRCKDGTSLDIDVNVTYIADSGRFCIFLRDISEQKQVHDALKESHRRYRELFNTMLDGYALHEIICDESGKPIDYRFIDINPAFEQFTGLDRTIIGKTVLEVLPHTEQSWIDTYGGVALTGETVRFENYSQDLEKWFHVEAFRVEGNKFAVVFQDISHRIRMQAEARRAEILQAELAKEKEITIIKDRFISMVSHEFRTPLSIIQTSSDLLDRYIDKLTDNRRQQLLSQITEQVATLTKMTDGVLSIGRTQNGKTEFNPKGINLESFCHAVFDQVKFADNSGHVFKFKSNIPDENILIDDDLLKHILNNLLSNAVKYSPASSTITLDLDHDDQQVIISITDSGIGIPEEDIAYLFDPFHRAKNVGNIQGTGLGLAIVKEYVQLHKGCINVNSTLGKGSVFRVSLPKAPVYEI